MENIDKAAAEHAVALMLGASRRLRIVDAEARAGGMEYPYPMERRIQRELEGKNLLIVGFGPVAPILAVKAVGLEMDVRIWDADASEEDIKASGYEAAGSLAGGLEWGDYICCVDSFEGSEAGYRIDAAGFDTMKDGVFVVDISGRKTVDRAALLDAVASGKVSGAGLDGDSDAGLFAGTDNVLITGCCASLAGEL